MHHIHGRKSLVIIGGLFLLWLLTSAIGILSNALTYRELADQYGTPYPSGEDAP